MTRLEEHYKSTLVTSLMEQFSYQSVMQVPRITKITLNMGVGEALVNKNALESAVTDLAQISGQKPVVTKVRCKFQGTRRLVHRLQGDTAAGSHVRVPRPTDLRCFSPFTGFSGPISPFI